jgi:hypothetical protein
LCAGGAAHDRYGVCRVRQGWPVNGLLLAGVTRKGQHAELAAYGPFRYAAASTSSHRFVWTYADGGAMLSAAEERCTSSCRPGCAERSGLDGFHIGG